jgi:Fe-S cluster assembly protein SufD
MVDVLNEKETLLAAFTGFEKARAERDAPALRRLRRAGIERFVELGFPTSRNEDWRFTNVTPIARTAFRLAERVRGDEVRPLLDKVPQFRKRLVFVNGCFMPGLSNILDLPKGVVLDGLAQVLETRPALVEPHLAQHADYEEHAFTALNTGFTADGGFLLVPRGVALEAPIHLVYLSTARSPTMAHPRNLIVLEPSSQATIVETYLGPEAHVYLTNAVTEIVIGENARLDHYKLQSESKSAFHVATTQVHQARSSNFSTHSIGLGGSLVRNEVRVRLDGPGCEATVNGLYSISGTQHHDNHTVIDHAQPHCASHELYKGILDDKAHGVFNGKIFVRQDAQKTDAKQTNQTLLLSDDATINTKPQLEIYADDVKCTHGATVGQLDAEALFYLRSRGLAEAEARALLLFAFANDIIDRIKAAPLRVQLEADLLASQHLPTDVAVKEIE